MMHVPAIALALLLAAFAQPQQHEESQTLPAKELVARFVARVKWIEVIGKREGVAVPVGNQPELNWLVGIEILSIEKAAKLFDKKGEMILLIHSPALFFGQPKKRILGKDYLFNVFGELKDGIPHYYDAEVKEEKGRESGHPQAPACGDRQRNRAHLRR